MFESDVKIKLPGINAAQIKFQVLDCLRKEHWQVYISGKWFNYGILALIMSLDLNMMKNQIFYKPYDYGQYVGPDGKVYSIKNQTFLATANKKTLTYEWRWSHPTPSNSFGKYDHVVNSRFHNHPLAVTGKACIPALLILIMFGVMIWVFGRNKNITKLEVQSMHNIPYVRRITSISIQRVVDKADESDEPEPDVTDFGATPGKVMNTGDNENVSNTETWSIQNKPYVRQIANTWIKRANNKVDRIDKPDTDIAGYGAIPGYVNSTGDDENTSKTETWSIENKPYVRQFASTWIKKANNKVDKSEKSDVDVADYGAMPRQLISTGDNENVSRTEALSLQSKPYEPQIRRTWINRVNDTVTRDDEADRDINDYGRIPEHPIKFGDNVSHAYFFL